MTQRRIEVVSTAEPARCPRCEGEALLSARVPYGWANAGGGWVHGRTGVVLCPACDENTPHAAPLITWFHVHGKADHGDEELALLLAAWARNVSVPRLDEQAWKAEIGRWRRGDL
ncbi:DUF6300 family protein [Nonomuraea aurantiaca]|uniref:DUF6300 family protein n=1 Tax=Nonomuraea aurantiaca TaxID=2878562 RepID=UPI001CD96F0E|nr:DUF6300 family protein [Nonomuraea aurantiaca]MCA2224627.1 DUF6300 family protein [Nonomuraea aurantiaca]